MTLNTNDTIGTIDSTNEQIEYGESSRKLSLNIISSGDI
jgi:hypothetical protein